LNVAAAFLSPTIDTEAIWSWLGRRRHHTFERDSLTAAATSAERLVSASNRLGIA
jgi:hypothetical protein